MPERGFRKLATVHLVDQGYWVWMIPLASGPHSIGVCADPRFHPFERINEFDRLLDWFKEHEPPLAAALEKRLDDVMDFLVIKDFSYASTQIFSADRWSLVGEAGGFIDAYYSPGSDYIAYTNSMTKDLICRDLDGRGHRRGGRVLQLLLFPAVRADDRAVQGQVPGCSTTLR